MWPANLSVRLPVIALVSRDLTNKLIGLGPLLERKHHLLHGTHPVETIGY